MRRNKVRVVKRGNRDSFVLRWQDPVTGKPREQVSHAAKRSDAIREASRLEDKIQSGDFLSRVPWNVWICRYETEHLSGSSPKTRCIWISSRNKLEQFRSFAYLDELTDEVVAAWAIWMQAQGLSIASVATYMRQLRAALGWAKRAYRGYRPPYIALPRIAKAKKAKGRPVTAEEFDRMVEAIPKVVGKEHAKQWRRLLMGLWLLGRRLNQTLRLSWDHEDSPHIVDLDGREPYLLIPAPEEKGRMELRVPLMPDAVAYLRKWPADHRRGRVFRTHIGHPVSVSALITKIGAKAGIVVARRSVRKKTDVGTTTVPGVKFASAHDLRRSFASRWAMAGVEPLKLQLLTGHRDLQTVLQYYVDLDARALSREMQNRFGGQNGDQAKAGSRFE
jgi:integrase